MQNFEFNTFIKGLVTDTNPLTYQDGASKDELNMVLNKDGSRQRRKGLLIDGNGFTLEHGIKGKFKSYIWKNAGNSLDNFLIIYYYGYIYAFKLDDSFDFSNGYSFFNDFLNKSLNMSLFLSTYVGDILSIEESNSELYIVNRLISPLVVSYDKTEGFKVKILVIKIRDFYGLEDGLYVNEEPSVLSKEHKYNLLNQGWTEANINTYYNNTNPSPYSVIHGSGGLVSTTLGGLINI